MRSIREVLAQNFKMNRLKLGLTQEKLAEKADVSVHYIAMIETCKKYPKPEMLERLAAAFGIEPHQLFSVPDTPDEASARLLRQGIIDIKQAVRETIQETLAAGYKGKNKA
jgi:transcriptional regulator with XRE-family HTH domain